MAPGFFRWTWLRVRNAVHNADIPPLQYCYLRQTFTLYNILVTYVGAMARFKPDSVKILGFSRKFSDIRPNTQKITESSHLGLISGVSN